MNETHLKERLIERRQELLGEQHARIREVESTRTQTSADQVDQAADAVDFELTVDRAWRSSTELTAVLDALRKLDEGTFGRCESCDEAIGAARLEALPTARLCIDCQTKAEASGVFDAAIDRESGEFLR